MMDTRSKIKNRSNKSLQTTAANARYFHYDPIKINHPRNSIDSLGLVA